MTHTNHASVVSPEVASIASPHGQQVTSAENERRKHVFLTAITHDLRSPLTAIRTSAECLLEENSGLPSTSQAQLLHTIVDQTQRMSTLVDQLLDMSRIEADWLTLDCDWIELPSLIADVVADFSHLHRECSIELTIGPTIPLAYIDSDRLTQVLWNLLENTYKYAPCHVPVRVDARLTTVCEVLVSIADDGPGIPVEEREKIFQQFYRLDRDTFTRGCGLGLAICRGMVEAHGGRIWVEGNGAGSTFLFTLPLPDPNTSE